MQNATTSTEANQDKPVNDPSKSGPLSDKAPQLRPGVTNTTLRNNGVTITDIESDGKYGFRIPYYTFEASQDGREAVYDGKIPDSEFYRDRHANPIGDRKYTQPAGTKPHVYFPIGLSGLIKEKGYLIITEGEFKALSLVEAGYPTAGSGGIYNYASQGELLPELREIIDWAAMEGVDLKAVYFLGDADTALNEQFPDAVIKMRYYFEQSKLRIPLLLPRMPVKYMHKAKGIDDAKAGMSKEEFKTYFDNMLTEALKVSSKISRENLTEILFQRETDGVREFIAQSDEEKKLWCKERLARIASHVSSGYAEEIADLAVETKLFKKAKHFREEQKKQKEKLQKKLVERQRANKPPIPEIFYVPGAKTRYFYQTDSGEFTRVDHKGVTNYLIAAGHSPCSEGDHQLSDVNKIITLAEQKPFDSAGPIAGQMPGVLEVNGYRLLVTRGPVLLKPLPGDWTTIEKFLKSKLEYTTDFQAGNTLVQVQALHGWLSEAVNKLYYEGGRFTPSQALILCGTHGVGKNVMQDLITQLLGKRQADPFEYMNGGSGFNGELMGAEHWMMADKNSSLKFSDKERLKACIKQSVVNSAISINGKYSTPINLEIYRRVTISLNDQTDALRVLPGLSDDFQDKLMILHVMGELPFGKGQKFEDYSHWWGQILKELPAYLNYLLQEHEIDEEMADLRYGIQSYKDPVILRRIEEQSPEFRFLELLDAHNTSTFLQVPHSAKDLYERVFNEPSAKKELELIGCQGANKAGRFLAKLMETRPERFGPRSTVNGEVRYRILPKANSEPVQSEVEATNPESEIQGAMAA